MRRWLKRLLLIVALLLALGALLSGIGFTLFRSTPGWYGSRAKNTAAQLQQLAQQAENKLIDAQNWAAELRADAVRAARASQQGATEPATRAADSHIVEFTQDELNALFDKWSVLYGWQQHYGKYLNDPAVILHDGKLILAANVTDVGSIVSVQFRPHMEADGKLRVTLASVAGGNLPLPDAIWKKYRQSLESALQRKLPAWRQQAKISLTGAANQSAMAATMGELFTHVMRREPAEPILFLPLADGGDSVPVRLTDVEIDEGKLTLAVVPLTPAERVAFLSRIKSGSQ